MAEKNKSGYSEKQRKKYQRLYELASKKAGKTLSKWESNIDKAYKDPKIGKLVPKKQMMAQAKKDSEAVKSSVYNKKTQKLTAKKKWSDADVGSVKSDVYARNKKLGIRAAERLTKGKGVKGR